MSIAILIGMSDTGKLRDEEKELEEIKVREGAEGKETSHKRDMSEGE
jgi:hypothetical protein